MEMSVREARPHFAHALGAAERGERVTITKNGKPVAELGPPAVRKNPFSWERLEEWRRANEFEPLVPDSASDDDWFRAFDELDVASAMTDPQLEPDER